jgi:Carboxypeptidase regulatory-like domain/TonB dependent receptor
MTTLTARLQLYLDVAICISVLVFLSVPLQAQVTGGTLSGTVTDTSGGAIPNAQLTIEHVSTGTVRHVATDSAGFYTAPNLAPGIYQVTFSAPSFTTVVESNVLLTVGDKRVLDQVMGVGQFNQSVKVAAGAETVELASSTLSGEVNGTTVRELPLNGRDWVQLATLEPGVLPVRTQQSATSPNAPRAGRGFGTQISDAGHRIDQNNFRINGISVNDYANGAPGSVLGASLGVDAIQEFSVLTSNYSAEYGRTSGGVVNAIMKSGTNAFHGSAYWFLRDEGLDARNFFDPPVIPPFHRNNFGASIGGPIKKEKVFFFFDYEGVRQDTSLAEHDLTLSSAARAGNLCSIPAGNNCTPTTVTVNPLVSPFLALYPLPNAGLIGNGDVGTFNISALQVFTEDYLTARIDYKISERDSLFGSWFLDHNLLSQPDSFVLSTSASQIPRQMFSLEETHVFSATLVNAARIGFNRADGNAGIPGQALNPLAADTSLGSLPGRYAAILAVPGLTTMSGGLGNVAANHYLLNSFQAYDDAFFTRGNHSLKLGFAWEHQQVDSQSVSRENGSFKFPSLQGFLLDQPTSVQYSLASSSREAGARQTLFGAYVQDDWRVRSNLTLNLGLRYEPSTLPTEAHNQFQNIVDFYSGGAVPVNTMWRTNATLLNFDPRVGFSWDPLRSGKTAVRGGFGIFDIDPLPYVYMGGSTSASYPFIINISKGDLPPDSFPTEAITSTGFNPSSATTRFVELNPHRSYSMNWNLNIQREVTPSLTAMVGYVGSHSIHQPTTPDDMDMVLPTLTSAGYLWPFPVGSGTEFNPNVGSIRATTWGGSSSYSGLQVQLIKRMSHGFQAQGSYSWSKCLDNGSTAQVSDVFTNSLTSFLWIDPASYRGPCDFNLGQNLVANFVWDLPKPKFAETGVASYLLGGWEVAGIYTADTGLPFTVLTSGDPQGLKGTANPFPDRLPGCNPYNYNYRSNIDGSSYLNVNCFIPPVVPASFPSYSTRCQPAAASVAAVIPFTCMNLQGNSGRNQLYGPGLSNFDFSIIKNTYVPRISEGFDVQFRVEMFNILNRANFQPPTDNLYVLNQDGTPTQGAGFIDSTSTNSRQIQLGLKIIW